MYQQRFHWLETEEWVSLLTMLGTIFAAFASWKAAKASKKSAEISLKHREDQVSPELYISDRTFQLEYDSQSDLRSDHFTAKGFGDIGGINLNRPCLEISNVGRGHAKSINIQWYIDIEKVLANIKKSGIENPKIYFNETVLVVPESSGTLLDEDLKQEVKVLLTDKEDLLEIPYSYLSVLSYMHHLNLEKQIEDDVLPESLFESPQIEITLEYKFMNNKTEKKRFLITPKIYDKSNATSDEVLVKYESDIKFQVNEKIV